MRRVIEIYKDRVSGAIKFGVIFSIGSKELEGALNNREIVEIVERWVNREGWRPRFLEKGSDISLGKTGGIIEEGAYLEIERNTIERFSGYRVVDIVISGVKRRLEIEEVEINN